MDDIARRLPLSNVRRPDWDLRQLGALGLSAEADESVWRRVWSEEEKLNFASTPLFMVRIILLTLLARRRDCEHGRTAFSLPITAGGTITLYVL